MSESTPRFFSPEWFRAEAIRYANFEAETKEQLAWFQSQYGPDQLRALSGKELLTTLFYNDSDKKENLCYVLENNPKIRDNFGSISGGSAFKFGLFFHKQKLCWTTGSANKPKQLTEEEAIALGTEIRDQLVAGAEEIAKFGPVNTTADYEMLYEKVRQHIRLDNIWILKYYKMIFPELFHSAYSEDQQRHMLYALQIQPHENQFVRMGQIALFSKECGIPCEVLKKILDDTIGGYKPIYLINVFDDSEFAEWYNDSYCTIKYSELDDLEMYMDESKKIDVDRLTQIIGTNHHAKNNIMGLLFDSMFSNPERDSIAIKNFVQAENDNTIIVAADLDRLLGIGLLHGAYYYDNTANVSSRHKRKTEWKFVAQDSIKLCTNKLLLSNFEQIDDEQNLMLIYKLLYYHDQPDHESTFAGWMASGMAGEDYPEEVIQQQYVQVLKRVQLPDGKSVFEARSDDLRKFYTEKLQSKDGRAHTYEACAVKKYLTFLDQESKRQNLTSQNKKPKKQKNLSFVTSYDSPYDRNRIIFGAPGTGKSYTLNSEKDILLSDGGAYERVTFHPDYTYAHFVGTYKPVPCQDQNGNDAITYKYVPGPFMRTYVKALRNSREETPLPFLLIIEEINRANVAAVFGDIFQLLDRDDDETSEYAIQATEDMKRYLADELGGQPDDYAEIRLPDNFFIWATMNSADQGVFPMDTAFKRRWNFTYLNINAGEVSIAGKKVVLGNGGYQRDVEWNELRKAINDRLSSFRVNEDKLLGPFFLSKKVIPAAGEIDPARFMDAFKNKVLMYLYDDAAKQKRASLFASDVDTTKYSAVCDAFDERGVCAFCTEISCRFQPTDGDEA